MSERNKFYSKEEFFYANHDQELMMVKRKLQGILDSLPADNPPPFKLKSQLAFKLEALKRVEQGRS